MTTRNDSGGTSTSTKEWSFTSTGSNGKFETVNGQERLKWNNYTARKWIVTRSPGKDRFGNDRWFAGTAFKSAGFSDNDILTAQSRLAEAVKGHQFNLAVSAAEGKKTVQMVVNAVHSVGGAISDLRRGRFESAARRFGVARRPSKLSEKDVAGRWLELQYGWIPLFKDVYEAAKAYEAITSPSRVKRFYGNSSKRIVVDSSESPSLYQCRGTVVEQYRIIYELSESMSTARSLGLLDPATVAWELIPYSFVVDWFIPIGDYLENLNVIPQLQGRFLTTKTRRFKGSNNGTMLGVPFPKVPLVVASDFEMTRTVSGSLSVPRPQFEKLADAMSPTRIWNALALVTQRLR